MKTRILIASGLLLTGTTMAQDIYKVESLSSQDLNGTARFVGMGGAMNALGADLSTIATNPAGLGLYRRSDVAMTFSTTAQPNAQEFCDINKVRPSFDQMGFVYAMKVSPMVPFVNFGFNYQKRKNFKNYIGVNGFSTNGLSQTLQMLDLSYVNGWLDLSQDADRDMTTPLTCLGYDTQLLLPTFDEQGKLTGYTPVESDSYDYRRVQWGGIQEYDFNLSMNWNDQVYAGVTFGIHDVNFHSATDYGEMIINPSDNSLHPYYLNNDESLTGTGYDVKFGIILRPIEESAFRIGAAVHTPTFFDLTSSSYLYMNTPFTSENADFSEGDVMIGDNQYQIRTPWKFNLSMGTTIGNFLALDAEYEYSNYAGAQIRYPDYYDGYYPGFWDGSSKDTYLNQEIDRFLKPVSTLRLGMEARVHDNVTLRAGYNHVTAPIEKDAFLNLFTNSPSYFYNTNTDYVNLGAIDRLTCGIGWRSKHFYADFAYQYQHQKGDLYTFHVPTDGGETNRLQAAQANLNRHNAMLTIGYKF